MDTLKCLIIDDEPLAVELLKTYVEQTPFLSLSESFNSAMDALKLLNETAVDLLFLDINMPQITGLEFSKLLPPHTKVIFTTAYDQYALDGFKVNALDYLLKPISYLDFLKASNKAFEWFKMHNHSMNSTILNVDSIFVKSGYRIENIRYNDILYIENQKDYVKFYIENRQEPISSLMGLQALSEKLPNWLFMRVHRSFIVNLNKIRTVERNTIIFGKVYIPISETYRQNFNTFMDGKIL